jgi:aminopeptidase
MKILCNIVFLSVVFLSLCVDEAVAEQKDYDSIADSMVNQSLAIQPGEMVVISGNPSEVDLMAALQVAVSKAGGQPMLILNIPEANKREVLEMPMEYISQLPMQNLFLMKMADAFINVGSVQDPDLFGDVPEERMAAFRKASAPLVRASSSMRFRSASLGQTGGIPTSAYAESVGADAGELQEIFWEAVAVSPSDLLPAAIEVASLMKSGAEIRVMSKAGTDLVLEFGGNPARINAGRTADVQAANGPTNVWLPAGEAYGCVHSASGTLVVPWMSFRGVPIENLKLTFEDGAVTNMSADSNLTKLEEYFGASSETLKNASLVDIGLNPHSRSPKGSTYYSWEMGGMITVNLGNNLWAGCENDSDAGLSVHVPDATVSIGGKTVVKNGKLAL